MPLARISLTLSRHFSLSFIASGRCSGIHPVSSYSWCMYVRAGRPAFTWLYAGVHKSTSLMRLPLLLQQCTACLVRLTWIVFVMGEFIYLNIFLHRILFSRGFPPLLTYTFLPLSILSLYLIASASSIHKDSLFSFSSNIVRFSWFGNSVTFLFPLLFHSNPIFHSYILGALFYMFFYKCFRSISIFDILISSKVV